MTKMTPEARILGAILAVLLIVFWDDLFSWNLGFQAEAALAIGVTVSAAFFLVLELRKQNKKKQ